MSNFRFLMRVEAPPVVAELAAAPELWGQHPERTAAPGSPHRESEDIWLRFRDRSELVEASDYGAPHWSAWYPAAGRLPSLRPLVFDVMRAVEAEHLGGCMVTRLPAGGRIYPHTDDGWHARAMNCKAYIILQSERCANVCGGEAVWMAPGEVWLFRNDIVHSVANHGDRDRLAVILTMRTSSWPR